MTNAQNLENFVSIGINIPTRPGTQGVSLQTQQLEELYEIVGLLSGYGAIRINRPQIIATNIEVTPGSPDKVIISPVSTDNPGGNWFSGAQIVSIVGKTVTTALPVQGSALWAKVSSITGGNFNERLIVQQGMETPERTADISGTLRTEPISSVIDISLNAGHNLDSLVFYILINQTAILTQNGQFIFSQNNIALTT